MPLSTPHRPHDPGHNYYDKGIYLITIVVAERAAVFGTLNMDARHPAISPTPLGTAIQEEWEKTVTIQANKGRNVRILGTCVMPDHFHGIIEIGEKMDTSVGAIIQAFKSACTRRWREMRGLGPTRDGKPSSVCHNGKIWESTGEMIRHLSTSQRREFYASEEGRAYRPLFDDNYDDTICLATPNADGSLVYDERHLAAMVHYVEDNPRRAIIRRLHPDFMRRCMHISIGGQEYAAFGNLFLLKWGDKRQVFFHRKAQKGQKDAEGRFYPFDTPYEQTIQYQKESGELLEAARSGRAVLVTPGISEGEKRIKNTAITERLPLIHLQKEPISDYWKPEQSRFEACEDGTLLILAPYWGEQGEESDYTRFHSMNDMAAVVCDYADCRIIEN